MLPKTLPLPKMPKNKALQVIEFVRLYFYLVAEVHGNRTHLTRF